MTKKAAKDAKKSKPKPPVKDLIPDEAHQVGLAGGGTTKHDTAKNSISNVR